MAIMESQQVGGLRLCSQAKLLPFHVGVWLTLVLPAYGLLHYLPCGDWLAVFAGWW